MAVVTGSHRSSQATSEGAGASQISLDPKVGKMSEIVDITPKQNGFISEHVQKPLRDRQLAKLKKGTTINVFVGKRPNIALVGPKFPVELLAAAAPALAEGLKDVTDTSRHVVVLDMPSEAVGWFLRAALAGFAVPGSGSTASLSNFPPEVNAQHLKVLLSLGQRSYISFALMSLVTDAIINNELGVDKIGWIFADPAPKHVRAYADHLIETMCVAVLGGTMVRPLVGALHVPYFRYAMRLAIITKRPEIEKMFFEDRMPLTRFQIAYVFECTDERDVPVRKGVARGLLWMMRQGHDLNGLDHVRARNDYPVLDAMMKEVDKSWQRNNCTASVPEKQDVQLHRYQKQTQKGYHHQFKAPREAKKDMEAHSVKSDNSSMKQNSVQSDNSSMNPGSVKSDKSSVQTQLSEHKAIDAKGKETSQSLAEIMPKEQTLPEPPAYVLKTKKPRKAKKSVKKGNTKDGSIVHGDNTNNVQPTEKTPDTKTKTVKFAVDVELVDNSLTAAELAGTESEPMSTGTIEGTSEDGMEAEASPESDDMEVHTDSNKVEQKTTEKDTPVEMQVSAQADTAKVEEMADMSLMSSTDAQEMVVESTPNEEVAMDTSLVETISTSNGDDQSRCKTPEPDVSACSSPPSSTSSVSSKDSLKSILVLSREGSPERKHRSVSFDLPEWTPEEEAELEKKLDERKIELKGALRRGRALSIIGLSKSHNISMQEAKDIVEREENALHKVRQDTLDRLRKSEEDFVNTDFFNPACVGKNGFQYSPEVVIHQQNEDREPEQVAPKTTPILLNKPRYIMPEPTLSIEPSNIEASETKKDDAKSGVIEQLKTGTIGPLNRKLTGLSKSQIKRAKQKAKEAAKNQKQDDSKMNATATAPVTELKERTEKPDMAKTGSKKSAEVKPVKVKTDEEIAAKKHKFVKKCIQQLNRISFYKEAMAKESSANGNAATAKGIEAKSAKPGSTDTKPIAETAPEGNAAAIGSVKEKTAEANVTEEKIYVARFIDGRLVALIPVEAEPGDVEKIKTGQIKPEIIHLQQIKSELMKSELAEAEAITVPQNNTQPVEMEAVETEPINVENINTEMINVEPVETEPIKVEDINNEPVKVESVDVNKTDVTPAEVHTVNTKPVDQELNEEKPMELIDKPIEKKKSVSETLVEEEHPGKDCPVEKQTLEVTLINKGSGKDEQPEELPLDVTPINTEPADTKSVKDEQLQVTPINPEPADTISEQEEPTAVTEDDANVHENNSAGTEEEADAKSVQEEPLTAIASNVEQTGMNSANVEPMDVNKPSAAETKQGAKETKPVKPKRAGKMSIIGEGGIDGESQNVESRKAKRKAKKARAQKGSSSEDTSSTASSKNT